MNFLPGKRETGCLGTLLSIRFRPTPVSTVGGQCSVVNTRSTDSWHTQPRLSGCLVHPGLCPQLVKLPYLLISFLGTNHRLIPTLSKIVETSSECVPPLRRWFSGAVSPMALGPLCQHHSWQVPKGVASLASPWYGSPYFQDHALVFCDLVEPCFGGTCLLGNFKTVALSLPPYLAGT